MAQTITGRWAAAAAATGGAAHLAMVPGGGWMAALGLAMAAACLPCAWHLWRRPSVRTARAVIGMSLAMVALHASLVLSGMGATVGSGIGAHSHGVHEPAVGGAMDGHLVAMLAVIAIELATAWAAGAWVGRQRAARAAVVRR